MSQYGANVQPQGYGGPAPQGAWYYPGAVPVPQGPAAPPPPQWYPQGPPGVGGGGRGRSKGNLGGSITNRVKAELQVLKPGQLFDVTKEAVSLLALKSPQMYNDLLAGIGSVPQPAKAKGTTAGAVEIVLVQRQQAWKEACKGNDDVVYWQCVVDEVKERSGANASVEQEILAVSSEVDVRRYYRGKAIREDLLARCGLVRTGNGFALKPGFVEQVVPWQVNPLLAEGKRSGDGDGSDENLSDEEAVMQRALAIISRQRAKRTGDRARIPPPPQLGGTTSVTTSGATSS